MSEDVPSSSLLASIVHDLKASSAAIMAPNRTAGYLYCYDSYNMPAEWVAIKNALDENTVGGNADVYRHGEPVITNHLQKYIEGYYIESVMVVPVKRGSETIATLEIVHSDERVFGQEDLDKAIAFTEKIRIK